MRYPPVLRGAVVALAVLTGCQGSLCAQLDEANTERANQAKPCDPGARSSFDELQCVRGFKQLQCTSQDELQLQKQIDCLESLEACVPGKQDAFNDAALQCARYHYPLSARCQAVVD